jgi:hypothetical protein
VTDLVTSEILPKQVCLIINLTLGTVNTDAKGNYFLVECGKTYNKEDYTTKEVSDCCRKNGKTNLDIKD